MRFSLLAAILAFASCNQFGPDSKGAPEGNDLSQRPQYTVADLPDDISFHAKNKIVVDFKDGTTQAQIDEIEKSWGVDLSLEDEEEGQDSAITVGEFEGEEEALLAKIRENELVEVAEPLMTYSIGPELLQPLPGYPDSIPFKTDSDGFVPDDPLFAKQWNLNMIHMPTAWNITRGKGVIVAVLDTGIAYENRDDFRQVPDLKGAKFADGYDFVNDDTHPNDDHGHGTHVAGTIAQKTNNGEGVAGVAFEATLMPIKVLDHFGSGSSAAISDAIRWAADHGAKVINMSLGGGGRSEVMAHAVEYARAHGCVVVCAAGNGGRGIVEFPGAYPGSVAVGSVGPNGDKAPYSSWGKELDIAAPGGDKSMGEEAGIIQNTIDPEDVSKNVYASYQGTSMATPHVAGVAALLWANGAKNVDQVEKALFASAHPAKGMKGWSEQFGHGILDADAALKAVKKSEVSELLPNEMQLAQTDSVADSQSTGDDTMGIYSFSSVNWYSLVWAAGLLAFVLLTLTKKERPGYLNVLVSPGFLIPMVLCTMGAFFVQYVASPTAITTMISLPIPEWLNKIIFGRGNLANPLVYSALIPIVMSVFAIGIKSIRPMVGGVAIGFASILAYTIWSQAPGLSWLPFKFLAIPWLGINALVCLFVARAMLKKETV
jgi:serine protease